MKIEEEEVRADEHDTGRNDRMIGAMLAIQLKGSKAEYGIYVSVAVSIVLFVLISDRLGIFVRTVKELIAYAHLETAIFP